MSSQTKFKTIVTFVDESTGEQLQKAVAKQYYEQRKKSITTLQTRPGNYVKHITVSCRYRHPGQIELFEGTTGTQANT